MRRIPKSTQVLIFQRVTLFQKNFKPDDTASLPRSHWGQKGGHDNRVRTLLFAVFAFYLTVAPQHTVM